MIGEESAYSKNVIKWQIAREIAIKCVTLIHCPNAIEASTDSVDFNSWLVLRQLIVFPVVFLFMVGRFTNYKKYSSYKTLVLNHEKIKFDCKMPLLCPNLEVTT